MLNHFYENPWATAKLLFLVLAVLAAPGALFVWAKVWLRGKASGAESDLYGRLRKEMDALHGKLIEYQRKEREYNTIINNLTDQLEKVSHELNELLHTKD